MFEIRIDLNPALQSIQKELSSAVRDEAQDAMQWIIDAFVPEMGEVMSGPRTGRQYGDHIASAPGESLAHDSFEMYEKTMARMTGDLTAEIEFPMQAGWDPIFGGNRPTIMPALESAVKKFAKL